MPLPSHWSAPSEFLPRQGVVRSTSHVVASHCSVLVADHGPKICLQRSAVSALSKEETNRWGPMTRHFDKKKENKTHSTANAASLRKSNPELTAQFVDN